MNPKKNRHLKPRDSKWDVAGFHGITFRRFVDGGNLFWIIYFRTRDKQLAATNSTTRVSDITYYPHLAAYAIKQAKKGLLKFVNEEAKRGKCVK